jgi:hypothetical protein
MPTCPSCSHPTHTEQCTELLSSMPPRTPYYVSGDDGLIQDTPYCGCTLTTCQHCGHTNPHDQPPYYHCTYRALPPPDYDGLKRENHVCFCGLKYTKDEQPHVVRGGSSYRVLPDGTEERQYPISD